MEYFAGKVTYVEQDIVHVTLVRHNGQELGPFVSSVFVLHIPNHEFIIGDMIGVNVTKYGHSDDRPGSTSEVEDPVYDEQQVRESRNRLDWQGKYE